MSVLERVNGLPRSAHMGRLKGRQEKDKDCMTIFVDRPQEVPVNKKQFENVPRKKERKNEREINGRWNAIPEKRETYVLKDERK